MLSHFNIVLPTRFSADPLALIRNDKGVTAIEYGLIAGLVAVVIIGAVTLIGTNLTAKFQAVATALGL